MGSDSYVNAVLRCYVEQFSSKPPDWQNYLRFYVVPFGSGPNALARYLASLDRYYNVNFVSDSWRESIALSDRYFSLSLSLSFIFLFCFVLFYFVLFCSSFDSKTRKTTESVINIAWLRPLAPPPPVVHSLTSPFIHDLVGLVD